MSFASLVFESDRPQAKDVAIQLLSKAAANPIAHGYAVHISNTILGKIALKKGDIATAVKHLSSAGSAPASIGLSLKGPDMSLADALLESGETQAVSVFLDQCYRHELSDTSRRSIGSLARSHL